MSFLANELPAEVAIDDMEDFGPQRHQAVSQECQAQFLSSFSGQVLPKIDHVDMWWHRQIRRYHISVRDPYADTASALCLRNGSRKL
ncbi:hypothetical protein D9M68_912880 [compost metagenome]